MTCSRQHGFAWGKWQGWKMDKRGFFSVYACLFLAVLIGAAGIFIGAAKKSTIIGTARACSTLWSQSVLAEYDLNLQERYHLLGYYGYPALVHDKLAFYADETFNSKQDADLTITSCSLCDYSLRNVEVFREQIISTGKTVLTGVIDGPAEEIKGVTHHQRPAAQVLFEDLPSEGAETGLSLSSLEKTFDDVSNLKGLVKKSSDTGLQLSYIFSHFKDQTHPRELGTTYLQAEVEYLIGGKQTDDANESIVKRRIIALREPVNMAFLERDPVRSAAVYSAAELLTPSAAPATAQSIMTLWAYAESVNDYRLLAEGYPVPKMKTDASWATDLDAVLADDDVEGCIYTGTKKGDSYADYLRLMLMGMNENTRLLRMMDLIQINMRYSYYDTFLIVDYYGGISYTFDINGENCHVEETYE